MIENGKKFNSYLIYIYRIVYLFGLLRIQGIEKIVLYRNDLSLNFFNHFKAPLNIYRSSLYFYLQNIYMKRLIAL